MSGPISAARGPICSDCRIVFPMLEYVITFILVLFVIIVIILCLPKSYSGQNENHWLDDPMNKKVKNSLLLYLNTSLKSIITKHPSILPAFKQCIGNTRNRKSDLVQLRKKLLQTKLGNSNAGRNETWRSASRTKNLEWILNNLSNGKKETLKGPYLDIGCGDGSITASIYTNIINITDEPTHPRPICLEYGDERPGFNELVTRETDITTLKSNYFNTISAFMSLHHIPTIEAMMNDIDRISRPGSIFVMRDHDFTYCISNFDSKRDARQFLDWVHVLYYLAESHESSESVDWLYDMPRTDIVYQYQPMSYWDGLLKKIGFERISNRGSKKSLICSYYAVYKKNLTI